jgi:hypothetical protein
VRISISGTGLDKLRRLALPSGCTRLRAVVSKIVRQPRSANGTGNSEINWHNCTKTFGFASSFVVILRNLLIIAGRSPSSAVR